MERPSPRCLFAEECKCLDHLDERDGWYGNSRRMPMTDGSELAFRYEDGHVN